MDLSEALRARGREAVSCIIRLAASTDQGTALACRYPCVPVCASAASAWGSQKVIAIARYNAMAVPRAAVLVAVALPARLVYSPEPLPKGPGLR